MLKPPLPLSSPNKPLPPLPPNSSFVSSLSSNIRSNMFDVVSNCLSDSRSSSTLCSLSANKSGVSDWFYT